MKTPLPKSTTNEHVIMNSIMDLLRYNNYLVWRVNVGGTKYEDKHGKKQFVRFGQAGHSDIFAVQPGGRFVSLEVKTPARRKLATQFQLDWLQKVRDKGGIADVVCSVEEAAQLLGIRGLF